MKDKLKIVLGILVMLGAASGTELKWETLVIPEHNCSISLPLLFDYDSLMYRIDTIFRTTEKGETYPQYMYTIMFEDFILSLGIYDFTGNEIEELSAREGQEFLSQFIRLQKDRFKKAETLYSKRPLLNEIYPGLEFEIRGKNSFDDKKLVTCLMYLAKDRVYTMIFERDKFSWEQRNADEFKSQFLGSFKLLG